MDAALTIAVASSIQAALFVAPVLVLLSYLIAPAPMDLRFTTLEVVAVGRSVRLMSLVAQDGESHWMEGVHLLAVYVILALAFYRLPGTAHEGGAPAQRRRSRLARAASPAWSPLCRRTRPHNVTTA